MFYHGEYIETSSFHKYLLEILQKILLHEHIDTARCFNGIDLVNENTNEYQKAGLSFETTFDIYEEHRLTNELL